MINKIKDIPDGTEVWVKMKRSEWYNDDHLSIRFDAVGEDGGFAYLDDSNEVLTEEQMRDRFSGNDGMPKQGEMIEVRGEGFDEWSRHKFIALYEGTVITEYHSTFNPVSWDEWRFPPKKTELTLAEVEERLGLDVGSLIIK